MKKISMAFAVLGLTLSMAAPLRAESLDGTHWKMHPKSAVMRVVHSMMFWRSNKLAFDAGQVTKGKGKPTAYTTGQENGKTTWKMEKTTTKGAKTMNRKWHASMRKDVSWRQRNNNLQRRADSETLRVLTNGSRKK